MKGEQSKQSNHRPGTAESPLCLQELPLKLLAAGITALPFFGLGGVIEGTLR